MVLPDHDCKPAALAALRAVVAEFVDPDKSHDIQGKIKAVVQATPDMGDLIALFRIWAPGILQETCHHSLMLTRLATGLMKQRKGHEGSSFLKLPFKHVLQDVPDNAALATSSSTVGEALAELTSAGVMAASDVLDILQGAAGSKPDPTDCKRVMQCLQGFYLRLQDLSESNMEGLSDFHRGIRKLLPKLISKEAGDASKQPEVLSSALQQANLDHLAAALKLPVAPMAKPEDPEGYFTGLLRDGTDPSWAPELYYEPAALDLANADRSHLEPLTAYPSLPKPDKSYVSSPSTPIRSAVAEDDAHLQQVTQDDSPASSLDNAAPDLQEQGTSPSASPAGKPASKSKPSKEAAASAKSADAQAASQEIAAATEAAASSKQAKRAGGKRSKPAAQSGHGKPAIAPATASEPSSDEPAASTSRNWLGARLSSFSTLTSSLFGGRSQSSAEAAPDAASKPGTGQSTSKHKKRRKRNKGRAAAAADEGELESGSAAAEADADLAEDAAAPRSQASSPEGSMRSCLSDQLGSPRMSSPELLQAGAQEAAEPIVNGWHDPPGGDNLQNAEDAESQVSAEERANTGQPNKKSPKHKKKKKKPQQQRQQQHPLDDAGDDAFLEEAARAAQEERQRAAELQLEEAQLAAAAEKPSEATQTELLERRRDLLLRVSSPVAVLRFLLRHGTHRCSDLVRQAVVELVAETEADLDRLQLLPSSAFHHNSLSASDSTSDHSNPDQHKALMPSQPLALIQPGAEPEGSPHERAAACLARDENDSVPNGAGLLADPAAYRGEVIERLLHAMGPTDFLRMLQAPRDHRPDDYLSASEVAAVLAEIAALLSPSELHCIEQYSQRLEDMQDGKIPVGSIWPPKEVRQFFCLGGISQELLEKPQWDSDRALPLIPDLWQAPDYSDDDPDSPMQGKGNEGFQTMRKRLQKKRLEQAPKTSDPAPLQHPYQLEFTELERLEHLRGLHEEAKVFLWSLQAFNWPDRMQGIHILNGGGDRIYGYWGPPREKDDTKKNVPRIKAAKTQPALLDTEKRKEDPDPLQPLRHRNGVLDDSKQTLLVSWFDPRRDSNLPLWAYPAPINPFVRAQDFPDFSTFQELPQDQQTFWMQIGQAARDNLPDLKAERKRLREHTQKAHRPVVRNELVLRAIEAKLIWFRLEERFERASAFMKHLWLQQNAEGYLQ